MNGISNRDGLRGIGRPSDTSLKHAHRFAAFVLEGEAGTRPAGSGIPYDGSAFFPVECLLGFVVAHRG
jgi:hypothetical protein